MIHSKRPLTLYSVRLGLERKSGTFGTTATACNVATAGCAPSTTRRSPLASRANSASSWLLRGAGSQGGGQGGGEAALSLWCRLRCTMYKEVCPRIVDLVWEARVSRGTVVALPACWTRPCCILRTYWRLVLPSPPGLSSQPARWRLYVSVRLPPFAKVWQNCNFLRKMWRCR